MAQAKTGQPPAQRTRDKQGRYVGGDGVSGNPKGRPALRDEFKRFAQEKSIEALQVVYEIMAGVDTNQRDKTSAARLLIEYGYGRPAAEYDRDRLDLDIKRFEADTKQADGPKTIEIIVAPDAEDWGD